MKRRNCWKSLAEWKCGNCGGVVSQVTYGRFGPYPKTIFKHVGNRWTKPSCDNVKPEPISARTLNRQQDSLTERAGKLSLPVNQSVKGKAVLSAVSESGIALLGSEGQGTETLPTTPISTPRSGKEMNE